MIVFGPSWFEASLIFNTNNIDILYVSALLFQSSHKKRIQISLPLGLF